MPDLTGDTEIFGDSKAALRRRLLAGRRSLGPGALVSAAQALQSALAALIASRSRRVIAAYVPLGTEPGGADLPHALLGALASGLSFPSGSSLADTPAVLLPVLLPDGDLDWARYEGPSSLRPARRGLLEPAGPRLGVAAVTRADLVVVPALAVDRRGVRLGRGGGSYDRALARVSAGGGTAGGALTVALLHDGELLDAVPAEPHDRRVGAVVTPAEGLSALPDWTK